jgi:hypothetical protein
MDLTEDLYRLGMRNQVDAGFLDAWIEEIRELQDKEEMRDELIDAFFEKSRSKYFIQNFRILLKEFPGGIEQWENRLSKCGSWT